MVGMPLVMILMAGMPGSGKSTVARGLGAAFDIPVIDKDVLLGSLLSSGIVEDQAQSASYDLLFAMATDLVVGQGVSVVLDSPGGTVFIVDSAERVCRNGGAKLIPVLCSVDRGIRNERVASRTPTAAQPMGVSRTPGFARQRFTHLPDDRIDLDATGPVNEVVATASASVRKRMADLA
ncbi:MAG: AAA family ATPase [Thermomicrobiales bacterium]